MADPLGAARRPLRSGENEEEDDDDNLFSASTTAAAAQPTSPTSTSTQAAHSHTRNDDDDGGGGAHGSGYAQISLHDDHIPPEPDAALPSTTGALENPQYPPVSPAYYKRGQPSRITRWPRLILTLLAVGVSCLCISAVIDVSFPSSHLEPGRDAQSVADGVLAAMDRSADPCEDFYEYACGSWMRATKIPTDRNWYTKSFSVVTERIRLQLKDLVEGPLQTTRDPVTSKAAVFYAACLAQMASGPLNTLFFSPFRDAFNSLSDATSFARLFARLQVVNSVAFFDLTIGPDDKAPTRYAVFLGQGGLGMPHRDNYLSTSEHNVETRRRYLILIQKMLSAAGKARLIPRKGHPELAENILKLETALANVSKSPTEMRDPVKAYNPVALTSMPQNLVLPQFFTAAGIETARVNGTVVVDNPIFFQAVDQVMASLNTNDNIRKVVRGYLAFHLARVAARDGLIGSTAYVEHFKFTSYMYGNKDLPETWKACLKLTNKHLGEALGKAFVDKHFTDEQMNVAVKLSKALTSSFATTLSGLDWMDAETKQRAKQKLDAFRWKVGYSKMLDTYEDVTVTLNNFQANVHSALVHRFKKEVSHLGGPVNTAEWDMNPQTVNAYYSRVQNEMVFPAGIFQPPFFSDVYPDAMNYGGIGAIIGNEMSHGFDDKGRMYDKDGILRPWWSNASAAQYEKGAQCTIDLYNTFKPRDVDMHVLGNLTIGENIADTNGVNVAYRAFKTLPNNTKDGIPPPNVLLARELTNDQLFFVSFAQNWCALYRPERLKLFMMTDLHAPAKFRVLGSLSQSPAFAKAFSCRNGSRYNPVNKCKLW